MSFLVSTLYVVQALPEIDSCPDLDPDFAGLLLTDPRTYRVPEQYNRGPFVSGDQYVLAIKLLFLCDMRQEYGDNFFAGDAPIDAAFFDRWWTLTKTDAAENIGNVVSRIASADLGVVRSLLSDDVVSRIEDSR